VEAELSLKSQEGRRLAAAPAFFLPSGAPGFHYGFILAVPPSAKAGAASLQLSFQVQPAGTLPQSAVIPTQPGEASIQPAGTTSQPGEASVQPTGIPFQPAEALSKPLAMELAQGIVIQPKSFAREDIPLDSANTAIRSAPDPVKDAQTEVFAEIFRTKDTTALFALDPMVKPLRDSWRITAGFADQRRYLYANGGVDTSLHGGIDLGATTGTPVLACAPGRVVFAGNRIVTGNTVVLEHLPGLFSIYMHLSTISAAEGELLDAGQLLGKVGSTGLSTGPHLHWELRIGPQSVNPEYWLSRPILDKTWLSGEF